MPNHSDGEVGDFFELAVLQSEHPNSFQLLFRLTFTHFQYQISVDFSSESEIGLGIAIRHSDHSQ